MVQNIVEVNNVSKNFRHKGKDFYAVNGVSFSVQKGEIFGLLGPNGAGKTTVINILLGILKEGSGSVRVFGEKIGTSVLERMNLVSADIRFHWVLKCRDILEFYGRVYGVPEEERKKRIEKLSRIFGVDDFMDRKFMYLSTGERMRLNFAKALLNHPQLLLLDEPTLGLDPDIALRVRDEIKRVNRKFHTTVLLTSHYMHEVEQLCDRIAFMHQGRVVDMGSVSRIKLRNFSTYEILIKVDFVKSARELRKRGFSVSGRVLRKEVGIGDSLSGVLAFLSKRGMKILSVETRKPTLEDYFVKMASSKRGGGA